MNSLINTLNNTSGERVFWYSVVFLIGLGVIVDGIVKIVKHLRK